MGDSEREQILFEQLGEPTVEVEFEGQTPVVCTVNTEFEEVFGVDESDIVGDSLDDHIVPPDREGARHINREAAHGEPVEQEVCRETADGARWFLFRSVPFSQNGAQCGYGIYIDITERKRQQTRFQELIRHSSDVISILDAGGQLNYQSPSVERVFGYEPEEMIGENAFEYVHPEDREKTVNEFTRAVGDPTATPKVEYRFEHSDGSWRWVESVGNNQLSNPAVEGFVVNSRDITSRVESQQELELLKQVFSRVFRHNIRNELNVIQGYLEIIEDRETVNIDTQLEQIRTSTNKLLDHTQKTRLIEQVIQNRDTVEIEVADCVSSVLDDYRLQSGPETLVFDAENSVRVTAHPKLKAAVREVIDNAIRHAPDGNEPRVELRVETGAETATLVVEDDSGGISPSEIEVVDAKRESDLHHGSGVGLWLIRWIVERSDGTLEISRTNDGTRIEIQLVRASVEG